MNISEIIIYLRKSRSDDPSMSVEEVLAKHEKQLQEYAVDNFGVKVPESQIFREVVSGETIVDRPVMTSVLQMIESMSIKAVLVIEPQRLSRGDLKDCGTIINAFRYSSTLVITPPKTYNLQDEYDRKFFEMELMRGNDFLEYTKRILNRGREASCRSGNFIGSVAAYGYKKVKIGSGKSAFHTLEIIPEEADAIRLIYDLYVNHNYGFTKIARQLDLLGIKPRKNDHWNPASLKDLIENPVYIGKIRWNHAKTQKILVNGEIVKTRPRRTDTDSFILVDGKHDPIIDEETFNLAIAKKGKNPCVKKMNELQNPLAGLLTCGTCGKAMSYKKYKQGETLTTSMICNDQASCKTKSVQYEAVMDRIILATEGFLKDFEINAQANEKEPKISKENIIKNLQAELELMYQKDQKQKDAFEDGTYTKAEYLARNAKLQEAISAQMKAIQNAKDQIIPEEDYKAKIVKFSACLNALKDPDVSASSKNVLLKSIYDKIIYKNHMKSQSGIGRWIPNVFELEFFLKK